MSFVHPRRITAGTLALAVALSMLGTLPANAQTDSPSAEPSTVLPASYPYQPELPEPEVNLSDASIYRGAIPYDQIAPKLNGWMAQSDIISSQVVGRSTLGRDIYLVTMTAPETSAETAQQLAWRDEVKYDAATAATDTALLEGYKRPVWFNGNIHGNEWEGTDATMAYIEWLLENENTPAVQTMLSDYRLYFTVTNNPDGRVLGQRATGLNLDPNRDFVTNITPETTIVRDLASEIQPIFFIDLHGYTNVLQVEPCGPPHGSNYDYDLFIPHAYSAALKIEQDVVDAAIPGNTYSDKVTGATSTIKTDTSGILIPYRDTPSGWDDWPPIFTAQYVAYQGAIAYTVELPLGRVNNDATESARRTQVNTKVATTVIASTLDYVSENDDEILANQIEIFKRGAAGTPLKQIPANPDPADYTGPTEWIDEWGADDALGHYGDSETVFPRAYVIPTGAGQQSDSDAAYLVDFLISHGIQLRKTTTELTVGGTTYPEGSYLVDMHQPLRGLANALLAAGSDISSWVSSMYDISAWSQGYLWGATVDAIGTTTDPALDVESTSIVAADATGTVPGSSTSYLTFALDGVDDFAGLNALLNQGIPASLVGTNTVVLGNDSATLAAAKEVADTYGVAFAKSNGLELAGSDVKPLKPLTIGYTGSQDDTLSLQQLGFSTDQLKAVSAVTLQSNPGLLNDIDVLWLGAALTINATSQATAYQAMQAYVASGGGVVGRGTAAATFANTWYGAGITTVSGNSSGNGIVALDTVEDGVLGTLGTEYGFIYPAYSFTVASTGTGKVEQTYGAGNPLIAGHWRSTGAGTNGPANAAGKASVVSATTENGAKALVFGTSVVFRVHTRGHFSELATGLYWAAQAATGASVPVPVESEVSLTLSPTETVFGGTPSKATVKVTTASASTNRSGTVEILDGDSVIASGTVNSFGNAVVTLPADLDAGSHSLTAHYAPPAGVAIAEATSDAATLTVEKAQATVSLSLSATSQKLGQVSPVKATVSVDYSAGSAATNGEIELLSDGAVVATGTISASQAVIDVPASLSVGSHQLTARYLPASTSVSGADSSAVPFTVTKSDVVVKVSPKGAAYGKSSSATIEVKSATGTALTGSVRVQVDGKQVASPTLKNGKVTVTLPATLAAGKHTIVAVYSGSSTAAAARGDALVTIAKAKTTTKVKLSASKVKRGGKLTVSVTLSGYGSGKPDGKVSIKVKGKVVKTVTVSKKTTKVTIKLAKSLKGKVKIAATYSGSKNLLKSTSATKTVRVKS